MSTGTAPSGPAPANGSAAAAAAPPLAAAAAAAAAPAAAKGAPPAGPFTAADYEADRQVYVDLPLGLLHAAVIPHGASAAHPALTAGRKRLLCYFMHRYLEFRLPEVQALAEAARRGGTAYGPNPSSSSSGGGGGSSAGSGAAAGAAARAAAEQQQPAVVWERPHGDRVGLLCCLPSCLPACPVAGWRCCWPRMQRRSCCVAAACGAAGGACRRSPARCPHAAPLPTPSSPDRPP